jgi:Zn-dependent protease
MASAGLLFLSVFVHELAHSYIAWRNGISISRITLFIFGGAAELSEEAPNADVEFRISFAGPVTSFVMAGVLGLVYWTMRSLGLVQSTLVMEATPLPSSQTRIDIVSSEWHVEEFV